MNGEQIIRFYREEQKMNIFLRLGPKLGPLKQEKKGEVRTACVIHLFGCLTVRMTSSVTVEEAQ